MNNSIHRIFILSLLSIGFLGISLDSNAEDFEATKEKIEAAMAAEGRPKKDIERDKNREPIETLMFFGLRDDMKILELLPGGGWYTRILAPVMREKGDFSIAYGTGRVEEKLLTNEGFDKVKVLAPDAKLYRPEDAQFYTIENAEIDIRGADMVLTFRNYHSTILDGTWRTTPERIDAASILSKRSRKFNPWASSWSTTRPCMPGPMMSFAMRWGGKR
jgi:predicted methyltransferase